MSVASVYNYDVESNYELCCPDKIGVSGGSAKLQLSDDPGKTFEQDFNSDTGFTYNSALAEFIGGVVRQIDTVDTGEIYFHNFEQNDAVRSIGTAYPKLSGGATISGGYVVLSSGGICRVTKDNFVLGDGGNQGTIVIRFRPNFNGSFPSTTGFGYIYDSAIGAHGNRVLLYWNGTSMSFYIGDSANNESVVNATMPVMDNTKEYLLFAVINCNATGRKSQIWFSEVGATPLKLGEKDTSARNRTNTFSQDLYFNNTSKSLYDINYCVMYDRVLSQSEIENFQEPSIYRYRESKVDLPLFTYPNDGSIQEYTNLTTIETNAPREIWNGLYYNGVGWVVSDGSFAQANTKADIIANIATFTQSDTLQIDIVFGDSVTQMSIDNLIVTYTGQKYPSSAWLNPNTKIYADRIEAGSDKVIENGGHVKYIVYADGIWYWLNSGVLEVTDGEDDTKTNTIDEWNAFLPSWDPPGAVWVNFRAFLYSFDGSTTPELQKNIMYYDFNGDAEDGVNKCIVWGYKKNAEGEVDTSPMKIYLENDNVKYKNNISIRNDVVEVTPNDQGFWQVSLVENVNMEGTQKYVFNFGSGNLYKRTVPDTVSKNFWDLEE